MADLMWRCVCSQAPCVGLDCGVYLPGQAPRKKAAAKTPAEMAAIRAKAWETRRANELAKERGDV